MGLWDYLALTWFGPGSLRLSDWLHLDNYDLKIIRWRDPRDEAMDKVSAVDRGLINYLITDFFTMTCQPLTLDSQSRALKMPIFA